MIIAAATQKGGTGKTATALSLAQAAAYKGQRVLFIDLDPQGNSTQSFGARISAGMGNSYRLLTGGPADQLIMETDQGIDLIPAAWELSTVTGGRGSARRLHEALEPIRARYDVIAIDSPAVAGELQYNALFAADRLIIPLQADSYNLQSLYQTAETARQIQQSNSALQIAGIIITMFDGRSLLSRQMQTTIINKAAEMGIPYLGTVRQGIAIKEAAALQRSLYQHAPRSKPAADYMDIYQYMTNA